MELAYKIWASHYAQDRTNWNKIVKGVSYSQFDDDGNVDDECCCWWLWYNNKQPCAVRLGRFHSCYSHPLFVFFVISTSKVGHADRGFGVSSLFISRSVHARLQVAVCSGYDLCHPGWQFLWFLHFDHMTLKCRSNQTWLSVVAFMSDAPMMQIWLA